MESGNRPKRFFATNNDVGGAQGMIPVLKRLKDRGNEVTVWTVRDAPARVAFRQAGFDPDSEEAVSADIATMRAVLGRVKPDAIFVGVSSPDDGSEKFALQVGADMGIPSVVILESWPKNWLDGYAVRDVGLYKTAALICLPDEVSCEIMISHGFDAKRVVATGNPFNDDLAALKRERDAYREVYRTRLGLPQVACVMLWCTTDSLDDDPVDITLGVSEEVLVTEFLEAMRDCGGRGDRPLHAFLRQKPSYTSDRVCALIAKICPAVAFDNLAYKNGVPALLAADVVAGHATITVQTAALLGIPAVYCMPELNRPDPMITNALGLTVPLYESGALRELIASLARDSASTLARISQKMRPISLPNDATGNVIIALDAMLGR